MVEGYCGGKVFVLEEFGDECLFILGKNFGYFFVYLILGEGVFGVVVLVMYEFL